MWALVAVFESYFCLFFQGNEDLAAPVCFFSRGVQHFCLVTKCEKQHQLFSKRPLRYTILQLFAAKKIVVCSRDHLRSEHSTWWGGVWNPHTCCEVFTDCTYPVAILGKVRTRRALVEDYGLPFNIKPLADTQVRKPYPPLGKLARLYLSADGPHERCTTSSVERRLVGRRHATSLRVSILIPVSRITSRQEEYRLLQT